MLKITEAYKTAVISTAHVTAEDSNSCRLPVLTQSPIEVLTGYTAQNMVGLFVSECVTIAGQMNCVHSTSPKRRSPISR